MTFSYRLAMALGLCAGLAAGCAGGDSTLLLRPDVDNSGERVIEQVEWVPRFVLGGTEEDTLLQRPTQFSADSGGVTFIDLYAARVVRVSRAGAVEWTFGRQGAGPDEFMHLIGIALDREGSAWVLDRQNHRVTVIDRAGQPVQRIRLPESAVEPSAVVPTGDGAMVLYTSTTESPLFRVDGAGRVNEAEPLPWAEFSELHPLATQALMAGDSKDGTIALAFQLANGLLIRPRHGDGAVRASFVEATPFPVVSVVTEGTRTVSEVEEVTFSARSLSVDDGCVYIHFVGLTDSRSQVIDLYTSAGIYRRSFVLPRKVNYLTVHGGTVYAQYNDPFPTLEAWHASELVGPEACQ